MKFIPTELPDHREAHLDYWRAVGEWERFPDRDDIAGAHCQIAWEFHGFSANDLRTLDLEPTFPLYRIADAAHRWRSDG